VQTVHEVFRQDKKCRKKILKLGGEERKRRRLRRDLAKKKGKGEWGGNATIIS